MTHVWAFKARFRANAYGWKGSSLACKRLKEAVSEINKAARTDAVLAADGAVTLFERLWPALERIDTSSGAVGGAVYRAQQDLLPIVIKAPASRKTRDKWLDRLWTAIQEDGVSYLDPVEQRWGELCGSAEVASHWAGEFVGIIRTVWSDRSRHTFVSCTSMCFSSLLAAGRFQEVWDLLEMAPYPSWYDRKFGVEALLREGRIDEAIAYAEASRGLNQPDGAINAMCESILLDAGRSDEAYERYGLRVNENTTGLNNFRAIVKKYPDRDPEQILRSLAESSGEHGRWFAAAKDAGFFDLALEFAKAGHTDPRTLTRAARDFGVKEPRFAVAAGRIALDEMLSGYGYEITGAEVYEAYDYTVVAARHLGLEESTRNELTQAARAAESKHPFVAAALLRAASVRGPIILPAVRPSSPRFTRR